jgi:hypothetical protein
MVQSAITEPASQQRSGDPSSEAAAQRDDAVEPRSEAGKWVS